MVISGRKCSRQRGGGRGGGSLKGCDGAAAGSTSGHNWSPTLNKSINNVVTQNTYWEERREGEGGGGGLANWKEKNGLGQLSGHLSNCAILSMRQPQTQVHYFVNCVHFIYNHKRWPVSPDQPKMIQVCPCQHKTKTSQTETKVKPAK